MDQRARMASLDAFKTGSVNLIVCSDVAARGLDIPDVSHVYNFDVPTHAEDYVHRIGRTGRAGKSGIAVSIVTLADQNHVAEIEVLIGQKIDWLAGESLADLPEQAEIPHRPQRGMPGGKPHGNRKAQAANSSPRPASQSRKAADNSSEPALQPREAPVPLPARVKRPPLAGLKRQAESKHAHLPPKTHQPLRCDEDNAPVVGMGDHVPMFLLRPARSKTGKTPLDNCGRGKKTHAG
jgi:superfamily II DNA/RNA helicase